MDPPAPPLGGTDARVAQEAPAADQAPAEGQAEVAEGNIAEPPQEEPTASQDPELSQDQDTSPGFWTDFEVKTELLDEVPKWIKDPAMYVKYTSIDWDAAYEKGVQQRRMGRSRVERYKIRATFNPTCALTNVYAWELESMFYSTIHCAYIAPLLLFILPRRRGKIKCTTPLYLLRWKLCDHRWSAYSEELRGNGRTKSIRLPLLRGGFTGQPLAWVCLYGL